ncbi:hypothetical protein WA158_003773 [Blastocystis sp. Blastoise]
MSADQDWKPVSWNKRNEKKDASQKKAQVTNALRTGSAVTSTKFMAGKNSNAPERIASSRKIEEQEEDFSVKHVDLQLRLRIQKARLEKKLTQKELAVKINEKPSVIQEYESGKAIPTPQVLNKLERILGRVRS